MRRHLYTIASQINALEQQLRQRFNHESLNSKGALQLSDGKNQGDRNRGAHIKEEQKLNAQKDIEI